MSYKHQKVGAAQVEDRAVLYSRNTQPQWRQQNTITRASPSQDLANTPTQRRRRNNFIRHNPIQLAFPAMRHTLCTMGHHHRINLQSTSNGPSLNLLRTNDMASSRSRNTLPTRRSRTEILTNILPRNSTLLRDPRDCRICSDQTATQPRTRRTHRMATHSRTEATSGPA